MVSGAGVYLDGTSQRLAHLRGNLVGSFVRGEREFVNRVATARPQHPLYVCDDLPLGLGLVHVDGKHGLVHNDERAGIGETSSPHCRQPLPATLVQWGQTKPSGQRSQSRHTSNGASPSPTSGAVVTLGVGAPVGGI